MPIQLFHPLSSRVGVCIHTNLWISHTCMLTADIRHSLILLLHVAANINYLEDVVVGTKLQSTNVDLDVVLQKVFSQLADFLWPSGTPHQSLTVRLVDIKTGFQSKVFLPPPPSSNIHLGPPDPKMRVTQTWAVPFKSLTHLGKIRPIKSQLCDK